MILIISNSNDFSTNDVCEWLSFYDAAYHKLYAEDLIFSYKISIEINNDNIIKDDSLINLSEIKSVWYRRFTYYNLYKNVEVNRNINSETGAIFDYLKEKLKNKFWLNHPDYSTINKIYQLSKATEIGLNVPKSLITNKKSDLIKFLKKHPKTITKPLQRSLSYSDDTGKYNSYTQAINLESMTKDEFAISMFQEEIEKKYEIRAFILNENIYSMAIFSQQNDKTKTDYRQYDFVKPNRKIPYKFPISIEKKLLELMKLLKLNSGSLDIIKGKDGKYYFLEVNPVGQFGLLSNTCNYYIENKIALLLTNKNMEYDN